MMPSEVNNTSDGQPAPESARAAPSSRPMSLYSMTGPVAPPAATATPNAMGLLKALRRRLGIALTVGVLVAAAAGTTVWFLIPPPKTTARTQLHIAPTPPQIIFGIDQQGGIENFLNSQSYLLKSRFVLNAALREPEVAELITIKEQPDSLRWLESAIRVEFPNPEFMHVVLSGDREGDLVVLVKAVTRAYLDNVVNQEHNNRQKQLAALQKGLAKAEADWEGKRKPLQEMQKENGVITEKGMAILQQIYFEELQSSKRSLGEVRHQILSLQVEMGLRPDWTEQVWPQYAAVLNSLPGPGLPINHAAVTLLHDNILFYTPDRVEVDELIDKDEAVVKLTKQIQLLQAEIANMREKLKPAAFEARAKRDQEHLADLQKALESRRADLRPYYREQYLKHFLHDSQGKQAGMREQYRRLKMMESALVDKVNELDRMTKQSKKEMFDMSVLVKELAVGEKTMDRFMDRINAIKVEWEAPARITWPDDEAVTNTPDATKRKVMVSGGTAGVALALVLLAFSWFEFQSRRVNSPEEVVDNLGLRIVGTVPDHSPRSWRPWPWGNEINAAYTQSLLTESVDAARTLLLHVAQAEKLKIIMITSALAGEGKTSLSSHLAASLARSGRRVLLVDSDLRNPTLHRLFDRSRAPGLSELMRGQVDLAGAIRDTPIPSLWMISAGLADAVALQSLALDAIPKLFDQLRPQYDFIVVDSCPVLPVADSLLVGQHVDAVIFSLLRDVSRMPRVHAAYQRLALLGVRMLGAVVNGTQHDRYPADYHYISQDS